ncbi:putative nucleobase-ascorbate transporter 10 isoform X1 [Lycium barbarum]|uniref:putative nucleobase-ascorbate transporter 10 isoform X1 n=1 Tax=Lycium barbarum TaxID=112863 RepID=UPI00293E4FE9|nr:putative nucleobase-ascorbate transporter 10 isoform X1 [Lycium barbarum]
MSSGNNGSGANGAKKTEELHPHPIMEQLKNVQYCVNSPPRWGEALFLGFQHYILSLGNIVLIPSIIVPQMGGGNDEKAKVVQTLLFTSGVNTLLQSLLGTRLPLVVGGSYAYLIPISSIIQANRFAVLQDPELRFMHTMRSIQGALIVTSGFQILLGFLGLWRNAVRLLSPLSVAPLVALTGLGLYHLGFPLIAECIEIGIPQLIFMVVITQYLPTYLKLKRPICDRFAMLFSIAIVWFYAAILTWSGAYKNANEANCRTDSSGLISGSLWIDMPYPFQWGVPTFNSGDAFTMMVASFVASVESTGVFHASARYGSATPVPPSVVSRGVGWLGIGTMLNAFFGGVTGCTATAENAGLLAMTRVGSRRVVQISAGFMIFFSILGKFGAIFASIPASIMAAIYCIFFGYISSAGLGFLQFCNLNSFRTKFILGFSLFLGLSLPQYFREHRLCSGFGPLHTHSRWFNDTMSVIFMSHGTIAVVVAVFLDRTLPFSNDEAHKDNGSHWWDKFVVYTKDVRNDEFYKLPCQLNTFFPPY